ncbi:MAG TPA: hypothetical protein VJT15_17985 [Pyrinomonadaceae bacterium]|nr:hypothetical protein [Pyrinomonadaceae bacterium]
MSHSPTKESFEKLLSWLDPDRDRAGEKYEKIRTRLIKIFSARGCWVAEDLADRTINVVAGKIDWLLANYQGDPALYFYAVGRNVFLEWRKKNPPPKIPPPHPDKSETEQLLCHLDQCLLELPDDDRDLVLKYHEGEKQVRINNRKRLAEERGISPNALRIKVCHIHSRLRKIMEPFWPSDE